MFSKNRIRNLEVPLWAIHQAMPDKDYEFHAYIEGNYCWARVTHIPSNKKMMVGHFAVDKEWTRKLLICFNGAKTTYRDRTAEQHAKAARFYHSSFEPS